MRGPLEVIWVLFSPLLLASFFAELTTMLLAAVTLSAFILRAWGESLPAAATFSFPWCCHPNKDEPKQEYLEKKNQEVEIFNRIF
jgi:hypothetical protein